MQTPGTNIRERNGLILIGIQADQFIQHLRENVNDKGFVNVVVSKRATPSKHGHTHLMVTSNKKYNGGE